jgi:uncharacterized protein DUF1801
MAENKTRQTGISPREFLDRIADKEKKEDALVLLSMMEKITAKKPVMWGPSIIGFGKLHYEYASGHSGDICICGFSPRKHQISLYLSCNLEDYKDLLVKLGKHKTGKGCLYIKKMQDVNIKALETLIKKTYQDATERKQSQIVE